VDTIPTLRSTILIVDDLTENIKILLFMLKDTYELLSATSGRQALTLIASDRKPDLILLDVMMPEMDGYEVCAVLKQDPATRAIPVIFITAKSDAESEAQALAAGAVDFIHKPINREVVRARISLHLKQDRQAKELHLANAELSEWNAGLKSRVLQQTALLRKKLQESHQLDDPPDKGRESENPVSATLPILVEGKPLSILCVDDEEHILQALVRLFRNEQFQVLTATSAREGLAILKQKVNIGLILSDQRMPEMSGIEFLQKAAAIAPDASRMILTGYADMNTAIQAINQSGADRFQIKPWVDEELLQVVQNGMQQYRLKLENRRNREKLTKANAALRARILQQTSTIQEQFKTQRERNHHMGESIVFLLADLLNQRHRRLGRHSRSVATLARSMAKALNLSPVQEEEIARAALVHDIGLFGVSDRVFLNNMEFLSGDDVTDYREHPARGQELIETFDELQGIGQLIRHHHEAFDGSGFPDGLAGEDISLGGRIIHLASFIDTSYAQRTGMDAKYQLSKKIASGLGTLFDPTLSGAANLAIKEVLMDPMTTLPVSEEQKLPFTALKIGMVVTSNIYSRSGALIMEQGTQLTRNLLATIRNHQLMGTYQETAVYIRKET
jgi:response regulator RpfG family c-di-GMP phosphodiesterase